MGVLRMGHGTCRYQFALPRGEDGNPIVAAVETFAERPRFVYDHGEELGRHAELASARRVSRKDISSG